MSDTELARFAAAHPSVRAAAILTSDGTLREAISEQDETRDALAAFVVALEALADRSMSELGAGRLRTMLFDAEGGALLVVPAGDDHFVAVLMSDPYALGALWSDARALGLRLAPVLGVAA
ncbi:MAG: roadblock/LC7 domain-containing protein [Deltaproteobacteria bacterium]|nr:roadblock/LC7 domain-containing protein [Deltaproteobacteria bacterium]